MIPICLNDFHSVYTCSHNLFLNICYEYNTDSAIVILLSDLLSINVLIVY